MASARAASAADNHEDQAGGTSAAERASHPTSKSTTELLSGLCCLSVLDQQNVNRMCNDDGGHR